MANQRVCIIGGGVAGVGLWWTLSQPGQPGADWDVTIIHDDTTWGGHARTIPIQHNGAQTLVDTGVQFIVPLLYPNIDSLINRPDIGPSAPTVPFDDLKVACAFPRLAGAQQNWGNFPAYQTGSQFAMYTPEMRSDALRFQSFIDGVLGTDSRSETVKTYFDTLAIKYENQADFLNYFLYPYLSIINGYGKSLDNQVTFEDLAPLLASFPGLGSFTQPGKGYARFVYGASSLVNALASQAHLLKPSSKALLNCTVTAVSASKTLPGPVTVNWTEGGRKHGQAFDKVVITTDMLTAGGLLNNAANQPLWNSLYSKHLTTAQWDLHPGACYIHSDNTMLSPDLQLQQETLQFTAYYAPQVGAPFYDMFKTYTTYIEENIHNTAESKGLYVTMYGYIPDPANGDRVPDPTKVLFQENWSHGMWLPEFMLKAKQALHMAQGKGVRLTYPGQLDTGIYFAGNNTTADALEHAFISGEIIANYAFGSPFPLIGAHLRNLAAYAMYYLFYTNFMFPGSAPSAGLAHAAPGLERS